MTFLRRYHIWPVWRPGESLFGRLRWVIWRWWTWELRKAYRRTHCREHEPISVRVGLMRDFTDGNPVAQRVMCSYCHLTLNEYPLR